jgi:hypothetical protein
MRVLPGSGQLVRSQHPQPEAAQQGTDVAPKAGHPSLRPYVIWRMATPATVDVAAGLNAPWLAKDWGSV